MAHPPHLQTPRARTLEELQRFLDDEFKTIYAALTEFEAVDLRVTNVEPERPRDGLIVFADGTNWNPGAGRGLYVYDSGWIHFDTARVVWNEVASDQVLTDSQHRQGFLMDDTVARTITVPADATVGTFYMIVRKGSGTLTLQSTGSGLVNGGASVALGQNTLFRVECARNSGGSAAEWFVT